MIKRGRRTGRGEGGRGEGGRDGDKREKGGGEMGEETRLRYVGDEEADGKLSVLRVEAAGVSVFVLLC
jgi:hypothetical protein